MASDVNKTVTSETKTKTLTPKTKTKTSNREAVLLRAKRAMVMLMCGVKLRDRKRTGELMSMLGLCDDTVTGGAVVIEMVWPYNEEGYDL